MSNERLDWQKENDNNLIRHNNTLEEIKRIMAGLCGEQDLICFDPMHGELIHPDELSDMNKNLYYLLEDTIHLIRRLAAECGYIYNQ